MSSHKSFENPTRSPIIFSSMSNIMSSTKTILVILAVVGAVFVATRQTSAAKAAKIPGAIAADAGTAAAWQGQFGDATGNVGSVRGTAGYDPVGLAQNEAPVMASTRLL